MTLIQIPVDQTGHQTNDTLKFDSDGNLLVGESVVASIVIESADDLPDNAADGSSATLVAGTAPDTEVMTFRRNDGEGGWFGQSATFGAQLDTWAMGADNYSKAQRTSGWCVASEAIPAGKSYSVLDGPVDFTDSSFDPGTATGVIAVNDVTSPHSQKPFQADSSSDDLQCQDMRISYGSIVGDEFRGCAVLSGTRAVVDDLEYVYQGVVGGWGTAMELLSHVGQLFARGFTLQVHAYANMNSAPGGHKISVGLYWDQFDNGDGAAPQSTPPAGGLGVFPALVSLAGSEGSMTDNSERDFEMTVLNTAGTPTGFQTWNLTAPTMDILRPTVVVKMAAGAKYSGQFLNLTWAFRYVRLD